MLYLYLSFLTTFITSSTYCYINDLKKENNEKLMKQYKDILPIVAKNTFIYIPIISILTEKIVNVNYSWDEFNLFYMFIHIACAYPMIDFFFFIFHRIMHIPRIYRWSHKLHHKYKVTVGMEALYLHWFDLYFGNIMPLNIPIIFMPNLHIYTWMVYIFILISSTVISAHGLVFKNDHDMHHMYFNCNYGTGFYMDYIFNTENKTVPSNLKRMKNIKNKISQKRNK